MNFVNTEFDTFFALRDDAHTEQVNACAGDDVVYVLFLEPRTRPDPDAHLGEKLIENALHSFQSNPVLYHCELLITPRVDADPASDDATHIHHATYLGQESAWQPPSKSTSFYLMQNANRWRAVPVFAPGAAARVRRECNQQLHTPYSVARYLTSAAPLRALAPLLSDARGAPAHCATLTARVLKRSIGEEVALEHPSAYYGPTSLYADVARDAARKAGDVGAIALPLVDDDVVLAIEALLRGSMTPETIDGVGDALCEKAVRQLALRCANAYVGGDEVSQVLAERHLATALLRWTSLRGSASQPPSETESVECI
jgi:hypothetical protein